MAVVVQDVLIIGAGPAGQDHKQSCVDWIADSATVSRLLSLEI